MKKIIKNIGFDLYLITLLILTFFSYTGAIQEYLLPIFVGIGFLLIILGKDIFYIIPIPFFIQMSFSDMRDNVQLTTTYGLLFAFLIVVDIIINRKFTRKGFLTKPLLILVLSALLTTINGQDLFTSFAGFMQVAVVLGLYYYFINVIDSKKDNFRYVAKVMMYMSLLVTTEMIYYIYHTNELASYVISNRQIDLGWENLNVVIYANVISIPLIAYLIQQSKVKIVYMIFGIFSIIGILLTISRSSVVSLIIYIVLLIPLMFILSRQRLYLIIQGFLFIVILGGAIYFAQSHYEILSAYIQALETRDLFSMDDRLRLLQVAWEQFVAHPMVGSGGLYSSRVLIQEAGYNSLNYHNTVAQASTLGIIGIASFFYLFAKKVQLIMFSKDLFKWYVLLMVFITAFVNGTLQPMYFYTTYMVFLFLLIATVEVSLPLEITEKR
jgi:hypothetical protein